MGKPDIYRNFITKGPVCLEDNTASAWIFVPRDRAADFLGQFPAFSEEDIHADNVALSTEQIIELAQALKETKKQTGALTPPETADLFQLNRARKSIEDALRDYKEMESPFPSSVTVFLEEQEKLQTVDYTEDWEKNGISTIRDFYFAALVRDTSIEGELVRIYKPDSYGNFRQYNVPEAKIKNLFPMEPNQCQFQRIEEAKRQHTTPSAPNSPKV